MILLFSINFRWHYGMTLTLLRIPVAWHRIAQVPGVRISPNICGPFSMELATCHSAGAKNFEVAAGFLENLWGSVLEMDSWTQSKLPLKAHCNTQ